LTQEVGVAMTGTVQADGTTTVRKRLGLVKWPLEATFDGSPSLFLDIIVTAFREVVVVGFCVAECPDRRKL